MRRNVSSVVGAVVTALLYLAAVAVAWSVIAAVRASVEEYRATGEITGPRLSQAIGGATVTDKAWAFALVDAVVVLVCWSAWRRPATGARAPLGRGALLWILLSACGLQLAHLALGRVLSFDAGWLVVPAPVGAHPLAATAVPASALILLAILHPLAAELLFRGAITGRLAGAGLPAAAVIAVPAVLYSAVQPSVQGAAVALAFGVLAGYLRIRAGSVGAAVAAHYAFALAGIGMWGLLSVTRTDTGLWTAAAIGAVAAVGAARLAAARLTRTGGAE